MSQTFSPPIDNSNLEIKILDDLQKQFSQNGKYIVNAGRQFGKTAALAALYGASVGKILKFRKSTSNTTFGWYFRPCSFQFEDHDWKEQSQENWAGNVLIDFESTDFNIAYEYWKCSKCDAMTATLNKSSLVISSGKHATFFLLKTWGEYTCGESLVNSMMMK
ncbi:MAG TPA: hypothetical protein VIE65_13965 [Methylobacter sp.]